MPWERKAREGADTPPRAAVDTTGRNRTPPAEVTPGPRVRNVGHGHGSTERASTGTVAQDHQDMQAKIAGRRARASALMREKEERKARERKEHARRR